MNQKEFSVSDRRMMKFDETEYLQMDFGAAMKEVLKGKHVRRLEWRDKNVRLAFVDEKLMIYETEDGMFHPLVVSSGDIAGVDWVVTEKMERTIN